MPNLPLYLKLTFTFTLIAIAILLYLINKTKTRLWIMIAMVLSTLGDIFMTDCLDIGGFSMVPGVAFFMLSHVAYVFAYRTENDGPNKNLGTWIGIGVMIVSTILFEILAFTIPTTPNTTMSLLIPIYIAVIGWNLVENFTLAYNKKGLYNILPFAIVLFYLTDYWIFLDMVNITEKSTNLVWYFYPLAQLGLVLFSTKIKKVN